MLPMDEPYIYQGIAYKTSENFYQAMKLVKNDIAGRSEIAKLDPYKAKKAGRKIQQDNLLRSDWNDIKLDVMEYIYYALNSQKVLLGILN